MKITWILVCLVSILGFAVVSSNGQTLTAVERDLVQRLENISKYGNYSGNFDDKVYDENKAFKAALLGYGKRVDVMRYSFPKLRDHMRIVTSRDGKLRIYSWDEETGGTMHDHDSVFQFRGSSGKVMTWADDNEGEDSGGGFYHEIFQLASKSGTIYLGVSTFIGSTSYVGESIRILKIRGDALDHDAKLIRTSSGMQNSISFAYDFFSVVDRPERPIKLFKFDAASRTLSFPVVIEDEKTPQGRVTNKLIRYRFNGTHFEKVS
jgi:hypothetical protein